MNEDEAVTVLNILAQADGGCSHCALELFKYFLSHFPEFKPQANEVFKKHFDIGLEEED